MNPILWNVFWTNKIINHRYADSSDSFDTLSPLVPVRHRSKSAVLTLSCVPVSTESWWMWDIAGASTGRSPQEKITYVLIRLTWLVCEAWSMRLCIAVLCGAASWISSASSIIVWLLYTDGYIYPTSPPWTECEQRWIFKLVIIKSFFSVRVSALQRLEPRSSSSGLGRLRFTLC